MTHRLHILFRWDKERPVINASLCLCLLVFLIPVLLSGIGYAFDKFDSSRGYYSNVLLPIDPMGVITGNNQVSKRVDVNRRSTINADSVIAIFRIKSSVPSNNNLFVNCLITLNSGGSQQFSCSLLDIPPPSSIT